MFVEAWQHKNYLSVSVPKLLAAGFRDFLDSCGFKAGTTNAAESIHGMKFNNAQFSCIIA